jgi:type IV secretion system protein VirD4
MRNYAGHRLSPWLGHLMVSRSETARPLLTPGEIMQLPPADEIVMIAGTPPIRAKKVRYFEDRRLQARILPPPVLAKTDHQQLDDWTGRPLPPRPVQEQQVPSGMMDNEDPTGSEKRRQPELNRVTPIEKKPPIDNEFEIDPNDDEPDDATRLSRMSRIVQGLARQVSLDPNDGMEL